MPGEGPFCSNTFKTSFWVPAFKQVPFPPISRNQSASSSFCSKCLDDLIECCLPSACLQDHVPKPDDKEVFIDHTPEETVYVTSFGGFALDPCVACRSNIHAQLWFKSDYGSKVVPKLNGDVPSTFSCRIVVLKAKAAVSELLRLNVSVSTKYFQTAG